MTPAPPDLVVRSNLTEVGDYSAELVAGIASQAVRERGQFSIALSGGSTPKILFELLAQPPYSAQIPWKATHVFWSDERCVSAVDPQSNFGIAHDALLTSVPLPASHIHRIVGEASNPAAEAQRYAQDIRATLGKSRTPEFDLILLGLGEEGHTASIFPGVVVPDDPETLVAAVYVPKVAMWRITFTLPLINAARTVCFMVAGRAKADILTAVIRGPKSLRLPAQRVLPAHGRLLFVMDRAAASLLT